MPAFLRTLFVTAAALASGASLGADATASARNALARALHETHPQAAIELRGDEASPRAEQPECPRAWRVRGIDTALRRRMGVIVECVELPGRPVRIEFEVQARTTGWRLAHTVAGNDPLSPADLAPAVEDLVLHPDLLTGQDLGRWRLVRRFAEGHLLRKGDVVDARAVLRGDAVEVQVDAGAVSLRTRGTALATAHPGEQVKVSLAGSRDAVEGVLGDNRQVIVKP